MPTPTKGYWTKDGVKVPSVTTILSRFKDSGALMWWANRLAYDPYRQARAFIEQIVETGVLSSGVIDDAKRLLEKPADSYDYRAARDHAASIGTIVHARVDCHIRGRNFDPDPYITQEITDPIEASNVGYKAFLEWAGSTSFKLVEGEIQLVSNEHRFGGTPDVVLIRGQRVVGDWKTGDLYPEQVLPQLAAYGQLLIENGHELDLGGHAISINKNTGSFTHRYFTPEEMVKGWAYFLLLRKAYDMVKTLK